MTDQRQHETVGRLFRAGHAVYRCTRYVRASGFEMRAVSLPPDSTRKPGDIVSVSERAIGKTWHRDHNDETYEAHEQPCNCYVCEGRERA